MLPFRLGINTDQHLPWEEMLARWQLLEALGVDNVWVADHLLPWWTDDFHRTSQQVPWGDGATGDDGPFLEGWTLVSALMARTTRIRGGVLVTDNLFRHPAIVAKMAATVDQISGGRFELGVGAGWFEPEHVAYGFAFPPPGERVSMLDEALQVIDGLLHQQRTTIRGQHYSVENAPLSPKPRQGRLPIVIGASGPRMLKVVARYADTWNCHGSPDEIAARGAILRQACAVIDRNPDSIRWSLYGYASILGGDPFESTDAFRRIVEPYRAIGISEVIFELPDCYDERVLRSIVDDVLPEWQHPG